MAKKEFSAGEVMALQEELGKGIQVIGEQYSGIVKKLGSIDDRLEKIEDTLDLMKFTLRLKVDYRDFQVLEKRVIRLEKKLA